MENLNKRPSKGILRFSDNSRSNSIEKDIKWDEANIKETLHPDDKDYGFMSIDEPPTPYSRSPHGRSSENSDEEDLEAKTNELLERVSRKIKEPPVTIENVEKLLDEKDLDALENQERDSQGEKNELEKHVASTSTNISSPMMQDDVPNAGSSNVSDFELKRKRHYNEFYAVKLAKKLAQKSLNDEDDDDEEEEEEEEKNKVECDDGGASH